MVRTAFTVMALALVVAGCAATVDSPGAASDVRALAGHWQGTIWETGASFYQGQTALDVRLTEDGTWSGSIGKAQASGVARMHRRWLVLSGTATTEDGHQQPIYYELTGDASRRWGQIAATFAGRDGQGRVEHASVALYKVS
jgi:hypothetical protein